MLHIGKIIRKELRSQGVSVRDFADKINRSRQAVYDLFEREHIDTELLSRIGKELEVDFFSFYSKNKDSTPKEEEIASMNARNNLTLLQQKIEFLESKIQFLEEINTLLKANNELLKSSRQLKTERK